MASYSKNIVICCDGTANEFAADRTNVIKLFSTLAFDQEQIGYYHPGLGTMEPPGALTNIARRTTRLLGKAFGYGLEADIRDAYGFILNNFDPGDRLFLFGFSRGAYTVRAVASLLKMYGLLPRGNDALIPYAIRLLTGINKSPDGGDESARFRLAREFKDCFAHVPSPSPIHFVGVWDTVSSVGWIANPLRLPFTTDNNEITHGRHAVALDERRAFFRTNLWKRRADPPKGGPVDLKQVWFAGVHSDVGGGYPEAQSGLSKLALEWMIDEARVCGLRFDSAKVDRILGRTQPEFARPDPNAKLHESLTGGWRLAEILPKRHWSPTGTSWRPNLGARRKVPDGALVHWSVYERAGYSFVPPLGATRIEPPEPQP